MDGWWIPGSPGGPFFPSFPWSPSSPISPWSPGLKRKDSKEECQRGFDMHKESMFHIMFRAQFCSEGACQGHASKIPEHRSSVYGWLAFPMCQVLNLHTLTYCWHGWNIKAITGWWQTVGQKLLQQSTWAIECVCTRFSAGPVVGRVPSPKIESTVDVYNHFLTLHIPF